MEKVLLSIVSNKKLTENVYEMKLEGDVSAITAPVLPASTTVPLAANATEKVVTAARTAQVAFNLFLILLLL